VARLAIGYGGLVEPPIFALFVTRGLEDIAAKEFTTRSRGGRVLETRPKVLLVKADIAALKRLRTVDDVAVVSAQSSSVERLDNLTDLVSRADLEKSMMIAGRIGSFSGEFSVTVSAARTALGPAKVIEDAVSQAVSKHYGWRHVEMQRAAIDVRMFVDGTWALVGVRLFDQPLSRRSYRTANIRGSLRPTVAAALVMLAVDNGQRKRIWDPFCGAGTILCEAASMGHEIWGTDIDPEAVNASRENLSAVSSEFWTRIENADSTSPKTWQKHRSVDAIVSNLPWGKQVGIKSKQALYNSIASGVAQLARRGGVGVLLTAEPQPIVQRLSRDPDVTVDERRIGLLGQTPTILIIRSAQ